MNLPPEITGKHSWKQCIIGSDLVGRYSIRGAAPLVLTAYQVKKAVVLIAEATGHAAAHEQRQRPDLAPAGPL
jgi:hypothetical protein